ncbi:hypothetical protein, partial [Bacillus cereus]|uniref:hypothetical protein n=1 Tax=Bacillus cereus TaxID=1396 RepID=UPI000BFA3AC6
MKKTSDIKKNLKATVTTVTTAGILLTSITPSFAAGQQGNTGEQVAPTQEQQNQTLDALKDAELKQQQERSSVRGVIEPLDVFAMALENAQEIIGMTTFPNTLVTIQGENKDWSRQVKSDLDGYFKIDIPALPALSHYIIGAVNEELGVEREPYMNKVRKIYTGVLKAPIVNTEITDETKMIFGSGATGGESIVTVQGEGWVRHGLANSNGFFGVQIPKSSGGANITVSFVDIYSGQKSHENSITVKATVPTAPEVNEV